jgi:hypothetical protein
MRTQIFAHKGWIGIKSNVNAEGLLNKPLDKGQLGFVVNADFVDISPDALELLKQVPLSGDDLGEVDSYKSNNGTRVFSWLGGPIKMFKPAVITSSNSYDPTILVAATFEIIPDPKFIQAVEVAILNE